MINVSDPQRLAVPEHYVKGYVSYIRNAGFDPHEFATEFVQRTTQLGYAPDLKMAVKEFVKERLFVA